MIESFLEVVESFKTVWTVLGMVMLTGILISIADFLYVL